MITPTWRLTTRGSVNILLGNKLVLSVFIGLCLWMSTAFTTKKMDKANTSFFEFTWLELKTEVANNLMNLGQLSAKEADAWLTNERIVEFDCGPAFYQILEGSLEVFDANTGTYTDLANNSGGYINAIGYNVNDDFIYGFADDAQNGANLGIYNVGDLLRIDVDGTTTVVHTGTIKCYCFFWN